MAKYFGKRLVIGLITLFAHCDNNLFSDACIPGSPFAGETSKLPANVKEKLVEQYGLDKPVTEQYVRYLQNAVKGDFGTSLNRKGKAVSDIIMAGIPYTASLGLAAFCIALAVGILLGTISAFSKHQWVNNTVAFIATIGVSVPSFLLALLMMILFGVALHCLPIVGLGTWRHYIMPATARRFLQLR